MREFLTGAHTYGAHRVAIEIGVPLTGPAKRDDDALPLLLQVEVAHRLVAGASTRGCEMELATRLESGEVGLEIIWPRRAPAEVMQLKFAEVAALKTGVDRAHIFNDGRVGSSP